MCGIIGGYSFTQAGRKYLENIPIANDLLSKRGPDGGEVYSNKNIVLGHRRLSIIDVSAAGNQPMHSIDGRFTLIFNGEIFNFQELKENYLTAEEKASLRSHTDTEVFLQLYSRLKEKSFELLHGFFAAAIYDNKNEELILVRDRFGKKPLLYYSSEDAIVFGSEMKALFKLGIPKKINWTLLPVYFQLNYIPQPYSLVEGVHKLDQGHFLKIGHGNEIEKVCYYKLSIHSDAYTTLNYDQAKLQLVELMEDAVKFRLISDVPLGAFLSGGIDSSVVVALASRLTNKLRTFSIGYKDNPFFDETYYANLVASKYKTDHTVFSLTNNDFLEHVSNVLEYIDEPFADSSAIPEYILSYYTRKHVTVALSGDGGDEVFAGYNKHEAEWKMRNLKAARKLVNIASPLISMLPKSRNSKLTNRFRQLEKFQRAIGLSTTERYWLWASYLDEKKSFSLFSPSVLQKINASVNLNLEKEFTSCIKTNDFNEVLMADMNLVLLSDMLVKVDLMSMANSLEVRSPFLDQNVVDFAFSLPAEFKINGKIKKRIVQDSFRDLLPEELYNRPKKGFEIPLLHWFRNELSGLINNDLLNDEFIKEQQVFSPVAIRALKDRLNSKSPGDSPATIWALIVFQYWWKKYIQD